METISVLFALTVAGGLVSLAEAHGRLILPPSRSSMWRFGFPTPKNYQDMQLWCGGSWNQWGLNGGRCGICGDPYQQNPRENEAGGKYATGIISRCYRYFPTGQIIAVQVDLTVNHLGYFEFRLCEHNDTSTPTSQACLDANLLQFADGSTRHYVRERDYGVMTLNLRIPPTVVCTQCVLQWKYHTGNSWGRDKGGEGIGHGPQEEFYGCSDIAILPNCDDVTGKAATPH